MRHGLSAGALAGAVVCLLAAAPAGADLTTYGYSNARTGAMSGRGAISPAHVRHLITAWTAKVGGAVNAQPLVVHHVRAAGRKRTLVVAVTEHGWVTALDAATGRAIWRHRVGHRPIPPGCGASPANVFGVTATPVIDRHAGRVYVVDARGRAWAIRLVNGRVASGWPRRMGFTGGDFVWGALALSRGRLYVPVASLCDNGVYNGGVVAIDVKRPARMLRWRTITNPSAYAGGIWGWGGVSIEGSTGDVYAATGNSLGTSNEAEPNGERVVQLSADLVLRQANYPLIPPFTVGDRDFGTTPVLVHAPGCPPQAVAINKDGELFVYDRRHISLGPTQRLRVAGEGTGIALYGMPAWDRRTRTLVLISPTAPPGGRLHAGLQAFRLGSNCQLTLRWQSSFDAPDAGSAPTIAGSVVYAATGRNGRARAYRMSDGKPLNAWQLSNQAFAAPAIDSGAVYFADWSGQILKLRPRR